MPVLALVMTLAALVTPGQLAPQYPSPMSDSTRPHPRVERHEVPGRRAALALGTLYLPPAFDPAKPFPLIVHFHGAPWLVEHHVREKLTNAALVTVQIGSGSRVYADAFGDPARFGALLADVSSTIGELGQARRLGIDHAQFIQRRVRRDSSHSQATR